MLKKNPFEPIVSKKRNPFEPISGSIQESVSAPVVAPIKAAQPISPSPAPVPAPVVPKTQSIAAQYGLPESTISQGKPVQETQSIWNKAARAILPDQVEGFLGMNKTPIQKQILGQQQATEQLKSEQLKREATKLSPLTAGIYDKNYVSPPEKKVKEILSSPQVAPVIKEVAKRTSGTGIYSMIQAAGPKTFDEAYQANKAYQAGDPSRLNQFLYQLGDSTPQTALGVALNFIPYAGKPLSTTYWTALSTADQLENKGKVTSLGNIGIDVVLDSMLGKSIEAIFKTPAKSLISAMARNFTVEGGTEVSQDLLKYGNDYKNARTPEEKQAAIQAAKDYFTSGQILMTLGVGGISGAGIGAGAHFLNTKATQMGQQIPRESFATPTPPPPEGPAGQAGGQLTREEKDVSQTQPDTYGTVKEWGTQNQYVRDNPYRSQLEEMKTTGIYDENIVKEASRWEMGQVLQDKPAYLGSGALSSEEITAFAKKNNLWFRTKKGIPVIAKDIDSLNKVLNALDSGDQRELGLALGYIDTVPLDSSKQQLAPFSQQLDPSKSIGDLQTEYQATKPGFQKVSNFIDTMVQSGTVFPESAPIIKSILQGFNDGMLDKISYEENSNLTDSIGRFNYIIKRLQMQKGWDNKPGNDRIGARAFFHEFGHASWDMFLTDGERAYVTETYKSLKKKEQRAIFEGQSGNEKHHSKNEREFFAQSFSDYIFENKIPAAQMEPLLKRISNRLFQALKNLVNRGEVQAVKTLSPIYERILNDGPATPLGSLATKEPPSFKVDIQKMINELAPTTSQVSKQKEDTRKTLFATVEDLPKKPSKEVPVEDIMPATENSPMGAAEDIHQQATENLPPDIASTIEPLEEVINSQRNTPLNERIRKIDYLRTPWKVFERMNIRPVYQTLLKAYEGYVHELPQNIAKITAWSKTVSKESNERIFNFLDGKEVSLTPEESQVAQEIKTWLGQWADRMGMSKDARISDYITHIFPEGKGGEMPEEIAVLINKKIPGQVYNPFLLERQGAKGYLPDTWKALDAYAKRATRKVYMDPALAELSEASKHLTDVSQINYITKYVGALNMRPTESDIEWDNQIKSIFGGFFGPRPTARITRGLRMMISRAKIGLSMTSFAKNLTQGVNTYGELGTQYTLRGYMDLSKFGAKELNENGVLAAPFIEDRTYSAYKKGIERVDSVLFANMNASELINRGAAYYGAKAKFADGKITPKEFRKAFGKEMPTNYTPTMEDAVTYGKFIAAKTQFLFGSLNTPVGLSSDTSKMIFQFQTFGMKQVEFISGMVEDKEIAKLMRYVISSLILFSTIGGAFGMKWSDAGWPLRWGWPPAIQFFIDLYTGGVSGTDKYGNKLDIGQRARVAGKTLFTNVVPGGAQIIRTAEGLSAVNSKKETTAKGKLKYRIAPTTENYISGALFGKYNLPESKKYYKKQEQKKKGVKTKSGGNPFEPI